MLSPKNLIVLSLAVLLVACTVPRSPLDELPQWTPLPGVLYIDAGVSLGAISPYSYGSNHGPWATIRVELQEEALDSGITYLRFPAGNWGDQNDLPEIQIDWYIQLCREMGAEPSISVRLPGSTPEKAAEVVRYTNIEKGYNVRYWSIGNEPSLYDEEWDTVYYNETWRTFAEAMQAVDPDILLVGPDIHQYTGNEATDPRDSQGRLWMDEFLKANGDMVDIVSIHRYPFPRSWNSGAATIEDLRANSREWDAIIPNLREDIRQTVGHDLPIAVTEANSHWSRIGNGEATPDSFYNAIWWGDVLARLIRQKVDIVAYWTLASTSPSGYFGLLAAYEVRPTYYVYQLYQRFGAELVYASSDHPDLTILAARREDGALTVIVVNLNPEEAETRTLRLDHFTPGGEAEVWRLDPEHHAERIGTESIVDGGELTLPPQSITLYIIPPE